MITNDWGEILKDEFQKDYFVNLIAFLDEEYKNIKIFPPREEIFSALELSSYENTKVVFIGQDPYHGEGQAHGLCFSVKPGIEPPPSLKNMYKELQNDLGIIPPNHGYLVDWAKQGVFLLNAVLTVRAGEPTSHSRIGWTEFTDAVIKCISDNTQGVVFMLWGNFARSKKDLIDSSKHYILEAAHPSPLARGAFFGCRHFSKCNAILGRLGKTPIDWSL